MMLWAVSMKKHVTTQSHYCVYFWKTSMNSPATMEKSYEDGSPTMTCWGQMSGSFIDWKASYSRFRLAKQWRKG